MSVNNSKAFTLIELLVVISIISLLATLAVASLNNARMKARNTKRVANLETLSKALELYYDDSDQYYNSNNHYVYLDCVGGTFQALDTNTGDEGFWANLRPYIILESLADPLCKSSTNPIFYVSYNTHSYVLYTQLEPFGSDAPSQNIEEKNDNGFYCYRYEYFGGKQDPMEGTTLPPFLVPKRAPCP